MDILTYNNNQKNQSISTQISMEKLKTIIEPNII